jgi:TM2 domain-containing membrane protein YozV
MTILRRILPLILLTSCFRVGEELEPQINASVQDRYLKSLPSPFDHPQNGRQDWEKEEQIGMGFAKELDLYQAITAFKRASFLLPPTDHDQKMQLDYDMLLAYYLGSRYVETLYTFESTSLRSATPQFTPYHDLLVILYDSHIHLDQIEQADAITDYLSTYDPTTAQKLTLSKILRKGDIPALEKEASSHPDIQNLLAHYKLEKKSTFTAQTLNAFLPGAGYFYVGQNQSAITALLLNGLFIWASVYFFQHGNTAAGAIFTSVEAGWYFGGIYGAGQEAKLYNERIYEKLATPVMNEGRYFPILMLKYGF